MSASPTRCVELHPSRVNPDLRWRAALAAERAASWLPLASVPAIVWVAPTALVPLEWGGALHEQPPTWQAWCLSDAPDRIYLRLDRPTGLLEAVLHECRHLWQLAGGEWSATAAGCEVPANYVALEGDANRWAAEALNYPL